MALTPPVRRQAARRWRGAVRSPMLWFAGASLLAMVALGFAATAILRRQARGEAIRDAKQITRLAGEGTVKAHLTRIFERIGVTDRTQAALWAQRHRSGGRG